MKRLILALVVGLLAVCQVDAQSYNGKLGGLDTLTNATSKTYSLNITGKKANVTFQVNVIKISGTVGGTVALWTSADGGVKYFQLATTSLTDATAQYGFNYNYNPGNKYRVIVTTTGTQSSSHECWALYRD